MPLVSLGLDRISTDEPGRCSGHANAGMGGRKAQLEKIGALLEAPPWAPEPPCSKGQGCTLPYSSSATTNVPNISHADVSTVEPLQPLNLSFCQAVGRFGFTMHATAVPPDPGLNTIGRKVVGKQPHKTVTGPSVASSVALSTGFLDQNMCDIPAQGIIGSNDKDDKDDNNNNNNNNNEEDEQEEEGEGEEGSQ
ncbi:hypothetical protein BDR04DRAFT_1123086 [Suillus decipiens]|nr:hypothetical protein BDR04DRAFT_1123086 [Suillus decipiens]